MELTQEEIDALVRYTLRIKLLNGKVLFYPIDAANKHSLFNKLWNYSHGSEDNPPFPFLWFETVKNRNIIIANDSVANIAICSDLRQRSPKEPRYHDNFGLLGKEPVMEEWETEDGETEMIVFGDDPPQAVIYHKGKAPEDEQGQNPLTYSELEEGCLGAFYIELEGDCPLRKFVYLIDDDGEETFIPTEQILVMEFDSMLLYQAEEMDSEVFGTEEEMDDSANEDEEPGNNKTDLPF